MPFGAELRSDGRVRFRLWSPSHSEVRIELGHELMVMDAIGDGWHELVTDHSGQGMSYRFVLPDGLRVPDPASRHQPKDVHGPSELIDPASYDWRDAGWTGHAWKQAVIYELHIGCLHAGGHIPRGDR